VIRRLVLGSLLVCSEHHTRLVLANSLALQFGRLTHPTLVEGLIPLFSSAASAHNIVETRGAQIPSHEVNCYSNQQNKNQWFRSERNVFRYLRSALPACIRGQLTPIACFGEIDLDSRMGPLYDVASSSAHAAV
jgi:hypothetical protein